MKATKTSYDQLPIILNANAIAQTLGISRAGAYELMNSEGFPTLRIGKRMMVSKEHFIQWIERRAVKRYERKAANHRCRNTAGYAAKARPFHCGRAYPMRSAYPRWQSEDRQELAGFVAVPEGRGWRACVGTRGQPLRRAISLPGGYVQPDSEPIV